ncbi:DNA translocase FtsK [Vogesella urethralis]|uniref:DNA translocase FtsK n=1 Tax=Vogesella urethralis TaxID=2592656 RepID=UPI0011866035|nr:DNA translocase FtsK [Vogesella urethralis]
MEKFSKLLTKLKHVLHEDAPEHDDGQTAAPDQPEPAPVAITPRPPRRTLGAPAEAPPAVPPAAANPAKPPAPPAPRAAEPKPAARAEIIDKLPRELPRYQRQPKPAPASHKGSTPKLPVIGLDDVQRNLRRDLTRREKIAAYDGKPAPQVRDLPLIDPREVRASVQQLHSGRQAPPPPPLPPVILQPTPVMKKASHPTPPPPSPLAQQERERAAAALFGPQSSFAQAKADALAQRQAAPAADSHPAQPPATPRPPADIQADWRGASHAAEARAAGAPPALLTPAAAAQPATPAPADADDTLAAAWPEHHAPATDDFVLDDDFTLDAAPEPHSTELHATEPAAPTAQPQPDAAPAAVTSPAPAPAAPHGLAASPRWQQLRQPVAVPAAAPVWQGVTLRQTVATPEQPVTPARDHTADTTATVAANPPAAPAAAAATPAATSGTAVPSAAVEHGIQRGDIVWHLLDDEPDSAPPPSPTAAPAAANPGLVWQLIDEPAAAATATPAAAAAPWASSAAEPQASQALATPARPHIPVVYGDACLPSLDLLRPPEVHKAVQSEDYLIERGILIEEKCAEFKVKVAVVDAYAGPVITRYEVEPAVGVRGSQVVNLAKDLSRALGLASIRVVETIPGKTCMGLELPNPQRQMIRLSEIFGADVFQQSASKLTLALGHDITGAPVVTDLAKAPHLLVAGTTGSGKSVGVNAMILSMLYKATPDEVRFIMIDPKMLELSVYNDIPHLLAPVVTDMKLAANALNWCVGEMEKRYRLMSHLGVRNLAGYKDKVRAAEARGQRLVNPFSLTPETPEPLSTLPFIVVVVDEFADLMMVAGKKIEELIARLAQKARAAGIHLILATQRPSVDVITGLIKANIPTRIAFQVSSKIDSRTILDQMGAESLLGQGDMLFLPPGTGYPQRVHGAFVTDEEVHAIVEDLKQWGEPDYVEGLLTGESVADDDQADAKGRAAAGSEADPLYDEAVAIVLKTRKASISSVQRQLRIGYNRAARLIEDMEAAGIVSAMESNGNRTVLVPDRDY